MDDGGGGRRQGERNGERKGDGPKENTGDTSGDRVTEKVGRIVERPTRPSVSPETLKVHQTRPEELRTEGPLYTSDPRHDSLSSFQYRVTR